MWGTRPRTRATTPRRRNDPRNSARRRPRRRSPTRPNRRRRPTAAPSVGRHAGAQAQRRARTGRRQQDRQRHRPCVGGSARCRPDARRHPHHLGARRRRQHTGTRRPVDPHGRRPHRRGAELLQARRRACSPRSSTRRCATRTSRGSPSRSRSATPQGLVADNVLAFVEANAPSLNAAINSDRDRSFEFFGLRTVYDRYLLRHPQRREVIETPQYFFLRVACGLVAEPDGTGDIDAAVKFYDLMSSLAYLPSSPTLFNSGTSHSQMSSCYLLDSPEDSLEGIYKRYTDIAKLSKFAGGIGVAWHRVRAKGSLITGTNGLSNGIVPWLRTLDSSVAAVNQGGRRKGAACVYLESWHADIEDFLELRDNTGDHARRTHNLNIANWIPDLFMERVEKDWQWSLFDPKRVPAPHRPVRRRVRAGLPRRRGGGPLREAGVGPPALLEDDAHARPDRQRLDHVQGRVQREVQPDRCAQRRRLASCRAPVEPVHRDPRDHRPGQHRGLQPRLAQPRRLRRCGRPVRLRPPRRRRPPGRAVPRPGDRHQLLPDRPRPSSRTTSGDRSASA